MGGRSGGLETFWGQALTPAQCVPSNDFQQEDNVRPAEVYLTEGSIVLVLPLEQLRPSGSVYREVLQQQLQGGQGITTAECNQSIFVKGVLQGPPSGRPHTPSKSMA